MADTYDMAAEAEADRKQQRVLLVALNVWDRALRRDDCSAWCISGKHGSVHTWGDGKSWVLYVSCKSARGWASTKLRLAFCRVTQDGDDEGSLRLHRLPTADEAVVIRNLLGIQKRREVSEAERERLRALAFKPSPRCEARPDQNIALAGLAGPSA